MFGLVDLEIKKLDSFSSYNNDGTITTLDTNATATTTTTTTAFIIIVNVVVKCGNQEMYVSSCIQGQLVLQERKRERERDRERKGRKELELNLEHSYCLIFIQLVMPSLYITQQFPNPLL